ncbi:MAG: hypothetical protein WCI02_12150, partial [Planctomycetota bacterium]
RIHSRAITTQLFAGFFRFLIARDACGSQGSTQSQRMLPFGRANEHDPIFFDRTLGSSTLEHSSFERFLNG